VTRIIAGFAGSITIGVPGAGTRPTSDRVREAIFSALEAREAIHGARVLDLYSGSGALGLEAASRGATHVTLVDLAIEAVRTNATKVLKQAPADARPVVLPVARAVQSFLDMATDTWDMVFLDPPYSMPSEEVARNLLALAPRLAPGAIVVLERGSRSPEPSWPDGLSFERRKNYGDTTLYWFST
jgi:16S rRNA (guanine966-N2)-methyltransferase